MSALDNIVDRIRGLDLERRLGLTPNYPPVAIEFDRQDVSLVRLKKGRRNALSLEAHQALPMPEQTVSASVLRPTLGAPEELAKRVQELFTKTGTKPGRVSLVLPDNLAKVSLLSLPEKPASSKQLDEIVRFKMKRAVPFRLEEASMAYQVLEGGI